MQKVEYDPSNSYHQIKQNQVRTTHIKNIKTKLNQVKLKQNKNFKKKIWIISTECLNIRKVKPVPNLRHLIYLKKLKEAVVMTIVLIF